MFHLSHAFYIQSYVCPILHSTLASCMGHKSNFHSLFLFNLFRKMIKKPRGLQEKGSWLLGTCYSHTGFTAIITEYCRSVQSIHPAGSCILRPHAWPECLASWRGSESQPVELWLSQGTSLWKAGVVLSPFIATIFLSPFIIIYKKRMLRALTK